jgi:hypothetical protein
MDPIQRKITPNTPNVQGPQGPSGPGGAGATGKKFEVGAAEGAAGGGSTQGTQSVSRPAFTEMASVIQDGVGRSLTREQVRDELIDHETKSTFGDAATPEMSAAISDAFKNDPHLSQLFNQLYAQATAKK